MATRWNRYYDNQMKDPEMRRLIDAELVRLHLGSMIARKREEKRLSQTELAARAGMAPSKISAIESSAAKNIEIATLVRIANAMECELKTEFVTRKKKASATASADVAQRWISATARLTFRWRLTRSNVRINRTLL